MAKNPFTIRCLEEEASEVVSLLRKAASRPTSRQNALDLLAEGLLAFLALQVLLPVVCGLLSSALYEKYRKIETQSKAEDAKKEISQLAAAKHTSVPDEVIVNDVSAILRQRHVDESKAREIAEAVLHSIKQRVA